MMDGYEEVFMKRLLIGFVTLLCLMGALACDLTTATTAGTTGSLSSSTTTSSVTFTDSFTSSQTGTTVSSGTTTLPPTTTTTATPTTTTTTAATAPLSDPEFARPNGFAELTITDRGDQATEIVSVADEVAFLDALAAGAEIIEITGDLDLGFLEVSAAFSALGRNVTEVSSVYRRHSHLPLLHPTLLTTGVGRILISGFHGLMIYSPNGSTIRHCSFQISGSSDIVIRNLSLDELWEWDELTEGDYDENDWDWFTLENSSGIWLDHLTLHRSYDGLMDVKAGVSNVTLSWSRLVFEPTAFVRTQMDWLEANRTSNPYYKSFRDKGVTAEAMVTYAACQKKGFNLGNTEDGSGFEGITVTFHHLFVQNLCDRFPRLRKGDVHIYECILDNEGIYRYNIDNPGPDLVNQGIVTTEQGAVLMENSLFRYVANPIKNNQKDSTDSHWSGEYRVLDSELVNATRDYFGSDDDMGTLWTHSNASALKLTFGFRNYAELPYDYDLEDVYFLPETFVYLPPGTLSGGNVDWLLTLGNPA